MSGTSGHSSSDTLSDLIPWIYFSLPLDNLWVITHYYDTFIFAQIVPHSAFGRLFELGPVSVMYPIAIWALLYCLTLDIPGSSCTSPVPALGSTLFLGALVCFTGEQYLESKIEAWVRFTLVKWKGRKNWAGAGAAWEGEGQSAGLRREAGRHWERGWARKDRLALGWEHLWALASMQAKG